MLLSRPPVSLSMLLFSWCRFSLFLTGLLLLSACGEDSTQDDGESARTIPQNVTLTTGTRINELNWSGVSGAHGYTVYWSTEPGINTSTGTAIQTQQPHFEHRGLVNGVVHYYIVTSFTDFGQSAASTVIEGTPQAASPARPDELALQAGNARVTLRWDVVPGATHYTLYWQDSAGVNIEESTRIERVVSPFVHQGLDNDRDYFYRLVAENARGASETSEEHSAAPLLPSPSAPRVTQAETASGQVILHWQHTGVANEYELLWSDTDPLDDDNATLLPRVSSPYTHVPLLDGQTYYYRVRTRNGDRTSALSNLAQVTPPGEASVVEPGSVPAIPTDITVSLENGQLSLDWPPVDGALGYNLYWTSAETGDISIDDARLTQIQPPYTHIPLNNGILYRYRLSALNDHGESALSAEVNGIPQVIIPGVPSGIQVLAGDESILVRWNPVQRATGYTLTINDQVIADIYSPYRITGLTNATSYQLRLQAQNVGGLSELSGPVSATPREPAPNTPRQLAAYSSNAAVLLQWTAATPQDVNDSNEAVTGYRVYYATYPGVNSDNGTLIDATPTRNDDGRWQLHHTALQNGQRYYYVVSAQNIGGEGGLSQEVWARPRTPTPSTPVSLSAVAGDGEVVIGFTLSDDSELFTYNLYWTQALDEKRSSTEVISNIQPGYRFTDGANTNGTTYFFQISAVNNGKEGGLSDEVSATPQIPVPERAPQDTQTLTDSGQVTLDWTPVAKASGYVIYWATEPDVSPQASNRLSGDMIQPGFVHDGLENGQGYFYRVAAVNAGGEGALSGLLAAQPQIQAPEIPNSINVQPDDGQVTIGFELSPTATHYRVFWHPDVDAPFTQWFSRTLLPGDILAEQDNGQTIFYRLQAFNAGGASPLSTPISATPQPKPPVAPTGLAVATGDGELNISWHTRPDLRYTLYWSDNPDIAPQDSGNVLSNARPTYRHTGLNNTPYRYQVSASNSGGESVPSEPVSAIPSNGAPDAPQGVQGSTDNGQNTLQWQAVTNATHYSVQWSTQADMTELQSAIVNASVFMHNIPVNTLYYRVIAHNSTGDSSPSVIVEITQDSLNQAPQITQGAVVSVTLDEDSTPVPFALTLNASDNDDDNLTWSTVTLANRGNAQVIGNNTFATVSYTPQANVNGNDVFTVQVSDGQGGTDSIQIDVSITPQNDAPTITNSTLMIPIAENTTTVTTIMVEDIDSSTFTYTLSGADSGLFSVSGNALNFATAPDFETPQDSGGDNVYNVSVTANDGSSNSAPKAFAISIVNANDSAPVITNTNLNPGIVENTTAVTAITVTDTDSSTFTYTLSGADRALFTLVGNNLRFAVAPNFETPQDSGGDNIYHVSVTVNDGINSSAAVAFAITVTDADDSAPVITNTNFSPSIAENTTAVIAITVMDTDSTTFTYTLGGADSGLFTMTGNSLRFIAAPDFDTPQDSGGDNVYNVSVTANDGTNNSTAAAFAITVIDANDSAPVITNSNLSPSIAENATAVTVITVTDIDSTTFTYALNGADSALFTLAGNSLRFIAAPDFDTPQDSDGDNVYHVSVTANDGINESVAAAFAITVTDINDAAPVITNSNFSPSITENVTAVTVITVTDTDSTTFTYTLGGADSGLFSMSGNALNFSVTPDFETPQDSGGDNVYNVSVTANDGTNDSAAVAFAVAVIDTNDAAPVITNSNLSPGIAENTTAVAAIMVTDTDSTTFTYTLGGTDSTLFTLAGNSLRFIAAPNFEAPQDNGGDNVYNVSVTANDGTNNSTAAAFVISVTDTNDSAPVITNTNFMIPIAENTITVTAITVTDVDTGSPVFAYTLGGVDGAMFSMIGNTLHFIAAPDFDTPQDSDGDNVYHVSVIANDGTNNSTAAAFVITVTDANDLAPVITNSNLTPEMAENTTAVTVITVTDADSTTFTYILGGTDSALFSMAGNSLRFIAAPDFEIPQDSGGDNVYNVSVTANDGTNNSSVVAFAVTVTDANDSAPVITNTNLSPSIEENTTAISVITVTDADSTTFTYTLGGADSALFTMTGNSLRFSIAPNFETPQDSGGDNVYHVSVIANDGSNNSATKAFAITVSDTNDAAPVITNTNLSSSIEENSTAITVITVTDADSTTFTYTLGGADSGLFTMTGNSLRFIAAPNFETPQDSGGDNVYNVTIIANDGSNNSAAKAFAITVSDTNDVAPVITNTNLSPSIEENSTAITVITVTDADSTTFTYTLGGTDSGLFTVAGNSLRFITAPDFETPQDSGGDNIYNITIVANDGSNNSAAEAFAITVTDVNDAAPVITNTSLNPSIEENTTAVTTITVTDTDSTTFTYTLGGADNALFTMTGNSLRFIAAPNFETPQDSGGDNVYNVSVIANDGSNNSAAKAFAITVSDTNDAAPVITNSNLSPSIAENTTAVTVITVTDADSTTFTYTLGGTDSGLFTMTGNSLRFITAPDFETPQDSGGDNIYNVSVTANDGSNNSAAEAFAITVTDANDAAPVITNTNLNPSIEENTTAVTTITVTDTDSTTFTYTLGGADSALFVMTGNSLRFIAAPNFETPQDSGGDNVYNVSVIANDGSNNSAAKAFAITVTDVNDAAPVITNTNIIPDVDENTSAVTLITVTDADSTAFTYTLGGADSGLFNMSGNALSFTVAPDFETPQDNGGDNIYNVSVIANDGVNDSAAAVFAITVRNANDVIPQITNSATLSVPEQITAVTTITVTDADSTNFTYRIVGGIDSAFFNLGGADLAFTSLPDFLNPLDANSDNIYEVTVVANDGDHDSVAVTFVVTVTSSGPRWQVAERIENGNAISVFVPQVAIDANGNVFAVWAELNGSFKNNIWANRYVSGTGWNKDNFTKVNSGVSGAASWPQIAVDANGNAMAVWAQNDFAANRNVWANRYVVGNGWGTPKLIGIDGPKNLRGPQIAVNGVGNAFAVWTQDDGVWTNRYVVGSGWGNATFLGADGTGFDSYPQIAIDTNGNAFAVWEEPNGIYTHIWANRYVIGSGWSMAELIETNDVGDARFPQIAVDTDGSALAVWAQRDGSRYGVWANRYVVGNGWETAAPIDTDIGGSANWEPQIVMNADGNALAVWDQYNGSRKNIWANRYVAGSGWNSAILIETDDTGNAEKPQAALDGNGNGLVVWSQSDGTRVNIWANRHVVGSGWKSATLIETDDAGDAYNPQVVLDTKGVGVAVWQQSDGTRSNILSNRFE